MATNTPVVTVCPACTREIAPSEAVRPWGEGGPELHAECERRRRISLAALAARHTTYQVTEAGRRALRGES